MQCQGDGVRNVTLGVGNNRVTIHHYHRPRATLPWSTTEGSCGCLLNQFANLQKLKFCYWSSRDVHEQSLEKRINSQYRIVLKQ